MSKIFNSPSKYIQGPDELAKLGGYVDPLGTKALVINTPSGVKRVGAKVEAGFAEAKATKGVPFAIIMKTTKGKGVSYMENQAGWHGKAPNDEEYKIAMDELTAQLAEVEAM